jgi:ABC-2 type transport system permease protein
MRKLWLIALTTYRKRVRSGRFLLLTLGLPVLMVIAGAVPILTAGNGADVPAAIGVVDQTGQLAPVHEVAIEEALLDIDERLLFTPYPSPERAARALQVGEIGGYLLIPDGYFQGAAVSYFAAETPDAVVEEGLHLFLQRALLGQQPEWVFQRLQDPAHFAYVGLSSGETVAEGPGLLIRLLAPAVLAIVFALAVFLGAGQMGSAIIREKESRAMEMVITSLRPRELVAGKVLGMTLLSLTQFAIWIAGALVAATLAFAGDVELASLAIPWTTLLWGLALIIPAYFLFALLAAGVGIIAGDNQQAQQLAGLIGFFGLAPIWVLAPILNAPAGIVAVALTLFPLTAPTVALIRSIFGTVPVWQLGASLVILLLSLAFAIWFVAKIFRAAMLNYGQTLRPRQVWQVLTQA